MQRRDFLTALAATALTAVPAAAQDFVASVIAQLRAQGFQSVVEERTLLGRIRLTATRADGSREIIINPRTGEILRDLWTPASGAARNVSIIEDKPKTSGKDDDDDEDDESGHGGGDDDDDEGDDDDESGDDDNDEGDDDE